MHLRSTLQHPPSAWEGAGGSRGFIALLEGSRGAFGVRAAPDPTQGWQMGAGAARERLLLQGKSQRFSLCTGNSVPAEGSGLVPPAPGQAGSRKTASGSLNVFRVGGVWPEVTDLGGLFRL